MKNCEKKDEILKLAVKEEYPIGPAKVIEKILPNLTFSDIISLFEQIRTEQPTVANISLTSDSEILSKNGNAMEFLKTGGFTGIQLNEKEENHQRKGRNNLELNLAKWNIEANELNKKVSKRNHRGNHN